MVTGAGTEENAGRSRAVQIGEIDTHLDAGARDGLTVAAGLAPPTSVDIAEARSTVLDLCARAVRAGRADIAAELRAAIGPLADAETLTRRALGGGQ